MCARSSANRMGSGTHACEKMCTDSTESAQVPSKPPASAVGPHTISRALRLELCGSAVSLSHACPLSLPLTALARTIILAAIARVACAALPPCCFKPSQTTQKAVCLADCAPAGHAALRPTPLWQQPNPAQHMPARRRKQLRTQRTATAAQALCCAQARGWYAGPPRRSGQARAAGGALRRGRAWAYCYAAGAAGHGLGGVALSVGAHRAAGGRCGRGG